MEVVTVALFLLLAVVFSDLLVRALDRLLPFDVPPPVVQVALGALIALSPRLVVRLDPEVFFLLLLPPLLFLDGWRSAREELLRDKAVVVQLALGLVVFTVLGVGFFIHALIPAMPLPVAFALAAVLSPTDPVAVSAIARRVPMPPRVMNILEGESLLNDATGLVCFRLAVAAILTGTFSVGGAVVDFAWVACAGIAVGVGFTLLMAMAKNKASVYLGEDSGAQTLFSLLMPFGCYLLAEGVHASGILAAVAGGLTMGVVESHGKASASTRIRRSTFWDLVRFTVNGVIFVLLGEQLQTITAGALESADDSGRNSVGGLLFDVLAITAALALLRFVWVYVSLQLRLFRRRDDSPDDVKAARGHAPWRMLAVMSLAGVRGAVTLAAVLSLPLILPSGGRFPARDLAITLAMGVIATSLLLASIALPLLLKGLELPPDPAGAAEEAQARQQAARAAIAAVEHLERQRPDDDPEAAQRTAAAARVLETYRALIESRAGGAQAVAQAQRAEAIEREMLLAALHAERETIFALMRQHKLASPTARRLVRELDLQEARHRV